MSQKPSLTIRRHIKAPAAKIFGAWTEAAQLMQWFGPVGATVQKAEIEARMGARYHVIFTTRDGEENSVSGIYREVVPDRKLVFTWAWRTTPERESLVTVTLQPEGDGTLLTLLHEQFFDEAARDRHNQGWSSTMEKLVAFAERLQPTRYEQGKALMIAGLEERYALARMAEIPEQWKRCAAQMNLAPGDTAYGIVRGNQSGFDYLTGIDVTEASVQPMGTTLLRIPAQRYAVFVHPGPVTQIRETIGPAMHEWLPASGRQHAGPPDFIEHYGPGFDPFTGMGDIEIWIPIKN